MPRPPIHRQSRRVHRWELHHHSARSWSAVPQHLKTRRNAPMPRQKAAHRTFEDGGTRTRSIARTAAGNRALDWRAVCSISSLNSSSERAAAGRQGAFPLFLKPLGMEALLVLPADPPLSQEDFAQFPNSKQEGETCCLADTCCLSYLAISAARFCSKTKLQFGRLGDFCYSGFLSPQRFSAPAARPFLMREDCPS